MGSHQPGVELLLKTPVTEALGENTGESWCKADYKQTMPSMGSRKTYLDGSQTAYDVTKFYSRR